MNNGAFGENFPYSNFHDLNMDWIIQIAKDFLDQYSHIQETITNGEQSLQDIIATGEQSVADATSTGLDSLADKAEELEGLLNQWYTEHSQDIANELLSAINDFQTEANRIGATVIASIPSDYTAINAKVDYVENLLTSTEIKQRLDSSYYTENNAILSDDGTHTVIFNGWHTTPYLPIPTPNTAFSGNGFPTTAYNTFVLYDANHTVVYKGKGAFSIIVTNYPSAKYYRASEQYNTTSEYYVDITTNSIDYICSLNNLFTDGGKIPDSLFTIDGIISGNGLTINAVSGYLSTDYIPIFSRNIHFYGDYFPHAAYNSFVLYDETLTPIYMAHRKQHINIDNYPTAKYIRASKNTRTGEPEYSSYIGNGKKDIRITVGATTFYTTLKDGLENACKFNHSIVEVFPGTYNMRDEYGTALDNPASAIGYELSNNVEVYFDAGSYVSALFPTSNEAISTYVSPFRGKDFIIHNLNLRASNCRYGIHDEQASSPIPYRNVYDNCKIHMTSVASSGATFIAPQCIGGGLGEHGVIEIIGGIYESNGDADSSGNDKVTISYHNGSSANCDNKITIRDAYIGGTFPGRIRFGYYGSSNTPSLVEVSGCSMGASILVKAETPSSNINNFDLREWNNTIR